MLGGALLEQKKYAAAEPLLLEGYAGMKKRIKSIPEVGKIQLNYTVNRLIRYFSETGNTVEVKKWQMELYLYEREQLPMPRRSA